MLARAINSPGRAHQETISSHLKIILLTIGISHKVLCLHFVINLLHETNKVNLAVFRLVKCCLSASSGVVSTALEVHFRFFNVDIIPWKPRRTLESAQILRVTILVVHTLNKCISSAFHSALTTSIVVSTGLSFYTYRRSKCV